LALVVAPVQYWRGAFVYATSDFVTIIATIWKKIKFFLNLYFLESWIKIIKHDRGFICCYFYLIQLRPFLTIFFSPFFQFNQTCVLKILKLLVLSFWKMACFFSIRPFFGFVWVKMALCRAEMEK
jgi:hypothetical protein